MTAPPALAQEHDSNREQIRAALEAADRDLDKTTITEHVDCSRTTVGRHLERMDDAVETRRIGNRPLYELQATPRRLNDD